MDGQMDGQTKVPCILQDFAPLGLQPCLSFRFTTMQSRATGIADYVLPLGDLFLLPPLPIDMRLGWPCFVLFVFFYRFIALSSAGSRDVNSIVLSDQLLQTRMNSVMDVSRESLMR